MNFINEYPWVKWIFIVAGVLYLLEKYVGFSPIDKLINKATSYKFKMFSHLNDPKLKQLIEDFNQKQFTNVESSLSGMSPSYRAFAFKSLGQYGTMDVSEEWENNAPGNATPKIIKAYQLIHKAWEIRGRGTIDTVTEMDQKAFKKKLHLAEDELLAVNADGGKYQANVASALLKVYKSIDVERERIHSTFNEAQKANPNDADLNFQYFACISPKWGGTSEEMNAYTSTLEHRSDFINYLIQAQYYMDLVYFENYDGEEEKIKQFLDSMKSVQFPNEELYRFELYLLLYWTASNLKLKEDANYYKGIIEPYWED